MAGCMGLIVLAVAILPLLGVGGHEIYKAETGPDRTPSSPAHTETAKGLYLSMSASRSRVAFHSGWPA